MLEMVAADRRDLWVHFAGSLLILYYPFFIIHRFVVAGGGSFFFRGIFVVVALSLLWSLFHAWYVSLKRQHSRSFVASLGPQKKSRLKIIGATEPMFQGAALDGSFFDPRVFNATVHLNVDQPHKVRYTKSRFVLHNLIAPPAFLLMLIQTWRPDLMLIGKIAIVFLFFVYFCFGVYSTIRALRSSALRIAPGRLEFVTFPVFRRNALERRTIDVRGASVRVNLMEEFVSIKPKSGGPLLLPLSAYGAARDELIESVLIATTSQTMAPALPDDQLIG